MTGLLALPALTELAELATRAARGAGALLLDGMTDLRTSVETKTTATDMVTEMDRASEALIAGTILAARPDDAFLGEEGTVGAGTTGVRWIVDPLDGTTNYLYGFPAWAVSVAAEIDGEVAVGVVHDAFHGETFHALRGAGSWCNDQPLRVAGAERLATALVATGFGYDAGVRTRQAEALSRLLSSVRDVRRAGAASLDLCWVALGRVDLYYERGLQPWDWAAGTLVASEAGARVETLEDGTLVAGASHLVEPFIDILRTSGDVGRPRPS